MYDGSLKGKTLLVVDDEADLREIISLELEYFGAQVFQAESVPKALEVLDNHTIDLIVSDIRMPGSTGVDLLKTVRKKHVSLPAIILITGFADLDTSEALGLGAEALIHKPFDMDDLLSMVNKLLIKFPQRYEKNAGNDNGVLRFYFEHDFDEELEANIFFGRGGVKLFYKDQPVPLGHQKRIELHFKDKILEFSGVVRWKKILENDVSLGIEFTNLDAEMVNVANNFQEIPSYIPY